MNLGFVYGGFAPELDPLGLSVRFRSVGLQTPLCGMPLELMVVLLCYRPKSMMAYDCFIWGIS